MRLKRTEPVTVWLVLAQIGPIIRDNALNDGRFYFVMSEAEYQKTAG